MEKFILKLRVNSISDQDDAGPWIRRSSPTCFASSNRAALIAESTFTPRGQVSAATLITGIARAPIRPLSPANGWIKTSAPKARWESSIRSSLSSWKATHPPFSASRTMASTAIAIRVGAVGADAMSIGSLMARRARSGRRAAIFSDGSPRKTPSPSPTARLMCRIRRRLC